MLPKNGSAASDHRIYGQLDSSPMDPIMCAFKIVINPNLLVMLAKRWAFQNKLANFFLVEFGLKVDDLKSKDQILNFFRNV